MCGRFVLFSTETTLLDEIGSLPGVSEVHAPAGLPPANYNVAPTTIIPIIRRGIEAENLSTESLSSETTSETLMTVDPARWGLLPHWKKDLEGPPLFNARAETVASKPSFRDAFKKGRCIIPLDGYYEWHTPEGTKSKKQPYYVSSPDGKPLWAAGLWATGMDRLSATMVTTAATAEMEWLHGRLPKFLTEEEIMPWLDGAPLLDPSNVSGFSVRPVDTAVGNVRNNYPELIAPQDQ